MASDTDTATPEPGRRWFGLQGLGSRIAAALGRRGAAPAPARPAESPSLLRRRRSATRRHSPLTRRILLLNIVPVALLALGAVYLSDYEEELIDAELASLAVQGEMVAAGISEVAVAGGETTVNRMDADTARQLLTRLVRPTGVRARLFSETGELLGDSAVLSEAGRIHVMPLPPPEGRQRSSPNSANGSATGSPASFRVPTAFPNMSTAPRRRCATFPRPRARSGASTPRPCAWRPTAG